MKRISVGLVAATLLFGVHVSGAAQDAKPLDKLGPFERLYRDQCGNSAVESNIWEVVSGKVVKVPAGDRLVIDVPSADGRDGRRGVVVHLVGIDAPAPAEPFGRESQQRLESLALGKAVDVWTQLEVAHQDKLPGEVVGVAHLRVAWQDLNMEQVRAGMARHEDAAPYRMSNYTECTYRVAEGEARAARRGLWRQGGVSK